MVTGCLWHGLTGKNGEESGGFSFQILPSLALWQTLDTVSDLTSDQWADNRPVRRGEACKTCINLGVLPH
jgi:hypothetical protein